MTAGDSIRMTVRIGEEEDTVSYMVTDTEVTQPAVLDIISEPRRTWVCSEGGLSEALRMLTCVDDSVAVLFFC